MKSLLFLLPLYGSLCKGQADMADRVITRHSLQETVSFLSQDSLKGRLTGSVGASAAATFIAAWFDSAGLKPFSGTPGYFDDFIIEYENKKIPARNVIAALPGKYTNDTLVIFSAHYDHIGQKDDLPYNKETSSSDDIFNGANDNATGVAALLELAKYYQANHNNRYLLLFVAFAGEEMGMLGSAHLVEKMKPAKIKAVINLEMLGRPVNDKCFIISFNNLVLKNLNRNLQKYQPAGEKKFFGNDPYPDEDLLHRSDHYPFSRKIKNAFTIMGSSPEDKFYHSVDDEYSTINFDFLLKATKNIALACELFIR